MSNVSTTNKDLSEFGRRESMAYVRPTSLRGSKWANVVSARTELELSHTLYGKPTVEELEALYNSFSEQIKAMTHGGA